MAQNDPRDNPNYRSTPDYYYRQPSARSRVNAADGLSLLDKIRQNVDPKTTIDVVGPKPDDPVMIADNRAIQRRLFPHIGGEAITENGKFQLFQAGGVIDCVGSCSTGNMEFLVKLHEALTEFLKEKGRI